MGAKGGNPFLDKNARYGPEVVANCEKREGGFNLPIVIRADVQFDNISEDPTKTKFQKTDEKCMRFKIGVGKFEFKTPFSLAGWKVFVAAVNLANEKFAL